MKSLSFLAVALLATTALLSTGCGSPEPAPAAPETPAEPATPADDMSEKPSGSSTSSITRSGNIELTAVSFSVEGMS